MTEKRTVLFEPWSVAISAAERDGNAAPLVELLRGDAPLTDGARAELADALERWSVRPKPALSDEDAALAAAAEEFRELCPPGHLRRLASRHKVAASSIRDVILAHVAKRYGVPVSSLNSFLQGRSRARRERVRG